MGGVYERVLVGLYLSYVYVPATKFCMLGSYTIYETNRE